MKRNREVLIVISIVIIMVVIFYSNNKVKNMPKSVKKYDELMLNDLENNYPQSPYEVIELNNEILTYIFSEDSTNEEIKSLIELQRKLFANTLLELNDVNSQLKDIMKTVDFNKENKIKIADTKINPPEHDENNYSVCNVKVHYYMTRGDDIDRQYTLIYEQGDKWKIYRWEDIQQSSSEVTNESK